MDIKNMVEEITEELSIENISIELNYNALIS